MEPMTTVTLRKPSGQVGWPVRRDVPSGGHLTAGVSPSPLGWPAGKVSRETRTLGDRAFAHVSRETPHTDSHAEARDRTAEGDSSGPEPARVSRETEPLRTAGQTGPGQTGHGQAGHGQADAPETERGSTVDRDEASQGQTDTVAPAPPSTAAPAPTTTVAPGSPRTVTAARTSDLPRPREPRVLTVANQKGGVGKTTTAVNMAAALSQSGLRVLVVDMDPQGNASTALGIEHGGDVAGIYDVLIDGTPLQEVVQESPSLPGLLCAPATVDLAGAEIELVPMVARESRLRKAVLAYLAVREDAGEPVDYVFIDCPPSLGLLTINSFVAGSEVLIPIQCEYYALEGLSQLLTNIDLIKEHLNPTLAVSHILLTMFDGRTRLSSQVADEVRSHFEGIVLRTSIPRSVRISEAPSHGETVITYDPISSGALCYLEAAKEVARAAQTDDNVRQEGDNG